MSTETKKPFLDTSVHNIDLNKIGWVSQNSGKIQFEEPANGSVLALTSDKPLNQQRVRLPEGHISAALFFSYFPEDVFRHGPTHPDWYKTFAETAIELAAMGTMPPISSTPG